MSSVIDKTAGTAARHVVQFYGHDGELISGAGGYLREAVATGGVAIAIASPEHLDAFSAHLRAGGVDPGAARAAGTLIELDAAEALAQFLRDDQVDRAAFDASIGAVIREAAATGRPVSAYGEMVGLLWDAGNVMATIDLETVWNELAAEVEFSLYCAYHGESLAGDEHADARDQVCCLHGAVVSAPSAATWHFRADSEAPRQARHAVAAALRGAGFRDELVDDAQLLVGELAANAVLHAASPFSIVLRADDAAVRLEVRDHSPVPPVMHERDLTRSSGRGLQLVAALAAVWGIDALPNGKVVWAELG